MRFEKFVPTDQLKPYIRYFAVSENESETTYKILPTSGLVIGFQYRGRLSLIKNGSAERLSPAGVTGISDSYKIFRNSPGIGTILVYFTEIGLTHFTSCPINELFNQSAALDTVFDRQQIAEIEERLASAQTDNQRIRIIEKFMLSQLKDTRADKLIAEAVRLIYESKGTIRIKELNEKLFISPSPFEKRFRKIVGATPKKFASIVRFTSILGQLHKTKSLTELCYENNFFDQAHFIKEFKQFTGDTPDNFKRFL